MDNEIKRRINYIDTGLKKYLDTLYPEIIYESMQYSVFAGGKRMRPILLLSVCEAMNSCQETALPFACGLEMIHTYSLIHDDLPCMDNDDFRRGKATNHKVFGDTMALLAGDALLNKAYEVMSSACTDYKTIKAMNTIANAAGTKGMIGGQVMDILCENKDIDNDTLLYIHTNKTAAIIKAAMLAGAYLSNATEDVISKLDNIGTTLGIAFQIKDDILDVIGDSQMLGKSTGSDDKNKKSTYVAIHGLEKAQIDYNTMLEDIFDKLDNINMNNTFLYRYIDFLADRKF